MASADDSGMGVPEFDLTGMGEIDALGVQSHMIFIAHLQQGFDARQAIYITAAMATGNPGYPPPGTQESTD